MTKEYVSTPYDDTFKTLTIDCPKLIIPIVNEIFGEHYSLNEKVYIGNEEHFQYQDGDYKSNIASDSTFRIGTNNKNYHFECQSVADGSIVVRMFEYDVAIALEKCEHTVDSLRIGMPYSAILYLRSTGNTPNKMKVSIVTPNGEFSYFVNVMKVKNYTIDDIFDRNLFFLIPFYIFNFENDFNKYEFHNESRRFVEEEYMQIMNRLDNACNDGIINEYEKLVIIELSKMVLSHITKKFNNIRKDIGDIMGGKVLEYPVKTSYKEGISYGISYGIDQGKIESLIDLVCKKIKKDKDLTQIASDLDMEEDELKDIYEASIASAPDYDVKEIYNKIKK